MERSFKDDVRDAVRYWEWRRIAYNLVLTAVVISQALIGDSADWSLGLVLLFALWAVSANVLYCLAYVADLVIQQAREPRLTRTVRITVFVVGTITGAIFAYFASGGVFGTTLD